MGIFPAAPPGLQWDQELQAVCVGQRGALLEGEAVAVSLGELPSSELRQKKGLQAEPLPGNHSTLQGTLLL